MKKISVVLIFILAFLFAPAVHAEVQNTLSDEILVQAKAQADLFLELKNALGLDWLDKYNAYLQNPASKPVPTWDTSISSLINKGYLSAAFPTDFAVSILGNEAQISRNISSQAVRNAVKIYIPSATVSGNTVKLLVQRPAQWVAWQDGLLGKVSRDGSDSPDVLPGAQLDFGSGASINFISNDGKILGVNSLTYKGEEADTRFVNAAGDNMTGDLTIKGNKAWHAGNDGAGSGLDADLLDGQSGSFYQNAGNLNAGIVPTARLSGTYNISISGNAATATNANYASSAGNADTVDGKHASDFALSGHTHGQYVQKTGDTMTGDLDISKGKAWFTLKSLTSGANDNEQAAGISIGESGKLGSAALHITYTGDGYAHIGMGTVSTAIPAYEAIRLKYTDNIVRFFATPTVSGNSIWHAGNDGAGSGMDADLLDGQHGAFYQNASNLSTGVVPVARLSGTYGISITGNAATATNADKLDGYHHDAFVKKAGDTMTGNLTLQGTSINIQRPETSGGYARGMMFYSKDGSAVEAGIGMLGSGNNPPQALYMGFGISPWSSSAGLTVTPTDITFKNNKVWHAGNDGSGSGLDADMLDGKHWTDIKNYVDDSGPAEGGWTQISIGSVVSSFASPGPDSYGLAFDGTYLWVSDITNDRIYKITTSGSVVSSFASPGPSSAGLAFDGTYLWVSDYSNDRIYKITTSGSVVSSFASPGPNSYGLAFDGTYLWVSDITNDRIYKITTSGSVVSSFASPGPFSYGLAFDGTYLWVSDYSNDRIYKITTSGSVVSSFASPGPSSAGLAFDGTYLWVSDYSYRQVYKILPEIAVWAK